VFNRGQSAEGIASASGRVENWKFVIQYCSTHPQGMGYVAGFRILFKEYYVLGVQLFADRIGNAHNTYMQTLADAGWLALGVYLVLLVRIILLGLRFTKKKLLLTVASDSRSSHAIRCSLILLVFCLAVGMDGADCCVPLRAPYYLQNITIAIILGISARMLTTSSARNIGCFR
jgi:O-antigen ligase